jgi:hypothetical protein
MPTLLEAAFHSSPSYSNINITATNEDSSNNNKTQQQQQQRYFNFNNKPYFKFEYQNGLCINIDSRRISDENNCEYEDRREERLKLNVPVNGNNTNNTIIYDLSPLEEEDNDVFPSLPFPTPPKQDMEKRQL